MSVYAKALDVIGSCKTREQLKVAEKYVRLTSRYVDINLTPLLKWALENKRATL
jgi:hypothetical protein